ncbi:unnamed protein product [marine sediment metagenome]|uniref:Uncharacterized protein n=1 Tax=marine sediment metagenome TaxID=412755 RepID=X1LTB3_9ZZZZ
MNKIFLIIICLTFITAFLLGVILGKIVYQKKVDKNFIKNDAISCNKFKKNKRDLRQRKPS